MDFQKLTDFLDSLGKKGIPARDCAIYYNHEPIYRHMSGFSDVAKTKKVSDKDIYWLYSATKIATCTATLQLSLLRRSKQFLLMIISPLLFQCLNTAQIYVYKSC